MSKFTASWLAVASDLLEAEFGSAFDLLPGAAISADASSLTFMVDLAGVWEGTFTASVDLEALGALFAALKPVGEGSGEADEPGTVADPAGGGLEAVGEQWQRLFRRICIEAAADLGRKSGAACEVAMISPEEQPAGVGGMGYQLRSGDGMAALVLLDQVERAAGQPVAAAPPAPSAAPPAPPPPGFGPPPPAAARPAEGGTAEVRLDTRGIELLLDVELEASLRFGARELALSDLLALGPGDVIQLDRAITDPVDLIVGDKIVARGEVVLVNGNFGLQVAEVAEPRRTLESIRCLF